MAIDEKREQNFDDTPIGWASLWAMEFEAAKKKFQPFLDTSDKIINRFIDDRKDGDASLVRRNYFTANVITKLNLMYGKVPKADVVRRFGDSEDELARIAAEIYDRALNEDIEDKDDNYQLTLKLCLFDRLVPGLGVARLAYGCDHETSSVEAIHKKDDMGETVMGEDGEPVVMADGYDEEKKVDEWVSTEYVHRKDFLYSPCRNHSELRWAAFNTQLPLKELKEKFGDEADLIPLNAQKAGDKAQSIDARDNDPWAKANVWEIWSKEHKSIFFYVEGYSKVLIPIGVEGDKDEEGNSTGKIPDPLGLSGFWPFPEPLMANTTTSAYMPTADFQLNADLYNEIDSVSQRIQMLEKALRAVGVYDKNSSELKRVLTEGKGNDMIPVENWGAFSEKGGFKGSMDFLPLDQIVAAIGALQERKMDLKQELFELTGESDLMRGQQMQNGTPGEAQMKQKFASVRMQALQDEFARFASDIQAIKAEIMAKHFDVETLLRKSNYQYTMDVGANANPDPQMQAQEQAMAMQKAHQACELMKEKHSEYRVVIKPESIAMADLAAMKSERGEWVQSASSFIQAAAPLLQATPGAMPMMLEILKWTLASVKGSAEIEAVFDKAIQASVAAGQQPKPPPPPDPRMLAQQLKGQQDVAKIQAETQAEMFRANNETQEIAKRKQIEANVNIQTEIKKQHIKNAMTPVHHPLGNVPPLGG